MGMVPICGHPPIRGRASRRGGPPHGREPPGTGTPPRRSARAGGLARRRTSAPTSTGLRVGLAWLEWRRWAATGGRRREDEVEERRSRSALFLPRLLEKGRFACVKSVYHTHLVLKLCSASRVFVTSTECFELREQSVLQLHLLFVTKHARGSAKRPTFDSGRLYTQQQTKSTCSVVLKPISSREEECKQLVVPAMGISTRSIITTPHAITSLAISFYSISVLVRAGGYWGWSCMSGQVWGGSWAAGVGWLLWMLLASSPTPTKRLNN